jgi:hypothetical protein
MATTEKAGSPKLTLVIGTVKGLFIYESNVRRTAWELSGPHLSGWEIISVCGDPRSGRMLAGTEHFEDGSTMRISSDRGQTWVGVKRNPKFAKAAKGAVAATLKHIWQIVPGHASQPGTWYAGVDDAALFVSRDDGET